MTGGPGERGMRGARVARLDGAGGAAEAAQVAPLDAVGTASSLASASADLTGLDDIAGEAARVATFGPDSAGVQGSGRPVGGGDAAAAPAALFDVEHVGSSRAGTPVADLDGARGGAARRTAQRPRTSETAEGATAAGRTAAGRTAVDRSVAERPTAERTAAGRRPTDPSDAHGARPDTGRPGRRGLGPAAGGGDRGRSRADRRPPGELDPDADPVAVAREICLRLLTDRARTRQELGQALRRKGVPDGAANTVLERFDEVGLIDDAAFAGQWVRSRHASRGLARRAIAMELRRKGVDNEVAGEALAEVDDESEERRARELVDRKLRSLTVDTTEQRATAARRLVGMLARKGYGGGTAYRVVREALAARGAEADEFGPDTV